MDSVLVFGSLLKCSYGVAPTPLATTPTAAKAGNSFIATETMTKLSNIFTFGMCTSQNNPIVKAAYGAPMPCIPAISGKWSPSSTKLKIGNTPAALKSSKCSCRYSGEISVLNVPTSACKTA